VQNVNQRKNLNQECFSNFLDSLGYLKHQDTIAVAVSSGVDSMCLLHLSDVWARKNKKSLYIVSYNHNLRKTSLREVNYVKNVCDNLGWKHKILSWDIPIKKNILENARKARYGAISKFCKKLNIDTLLLGHHADDLVETFFMRILKGSRIEGLCPMYSSRKLFDINLLRPFLRTPKQAIYNYAKYHNIKFFEDPTNKNKKYLRTKIRIFLSENYDLNLDLSKSVKLFCKLRLYFDCHTNHYFLNKVFLQSEGYIILKRKSLMALPSFLINKVLNKSVTDVGNNTYPLRERTLRRILNLIVTNTYTTFSAGGCLIKINKDLIFIIREFNQIKDFKVELDSGKNSLWDNKFLITNLSKKEKIFISTLGNELNNKKFNEFYRSKKKYSKKLPLEVKITLPVIKTLEGLVFIPHLNIYNSIILKDIVKIKNIDYCNVSGL